MRPPSLSRERGAREKEGKRGGEREIGRERGKEGKRERERERERGGGGGGGMEGDSERARTRQTLAARERLVLRRGTSPIRNRAPH